MDTPLDATRDLTISRIIKAPRAKVWAAWSDPKRFEQWWVPAPALCRVAKMELRPGGAMETEISEDGGDFAAHLSGCFLEIVEGERIVFTNALTEGWRPAAQPFMTAIITLADHPTGTDYRARVLHKSAADKQMHDDMGFADGWGTVIGQLAGLVEGK